MKDWQGEGWDWPLRDKINHATDSSQIWHLHDPRKLPDDFIHREGYSHERALIIEVCCSPGTLS